MQALVQEILAICDGNAGLSTPFDPEWTCIVDAKKIADVGMTLPPLLPGIWTFIPDPLDTIGSLLELKTICEKLQQATLNTYAWVDALLKTLAIIREFRMSLDSTTRAQSRPLTGIPSMFKEARAKSFNDFSTRTIRSPTSSHPATSSGRRPKTTTTTTSKPHTHQRRPQRRRRTYKTPPLSRTTSRPCATISTPASTTTMSSPHSLSNPTKTSMRTISHAHLAPSTTQEGMREGNRRG